MYGIIGSALALGVIVVQVIKRTKMKSMYGDAITIAPKNPTIARYIIGGTVFGLGWALAGACPGPMYIMIGAGYWTMIIVVIGALLGTWVYGLLKNKLPH